MKILFITCFFAPHNTIGAVRTTKHAEKLLELGCDIDVITADGIPFPKSLQTSFPKNRTFPVKWPNPLRLLRSFRTNEVDGIIEEIEGDGIVKAAVKEQVKDLIRKVAPLPDKYLFWYFNAIRIADRLIEENGKPDLIYASSSPYTSLIAAQAISKKYKTPWVAELRDLWADNHYKPKGYVGSKIEKAVLSSAASLITVSEPLAEKLRSKYPMPVHVIYNAYDEADFIYERKENASKVKKIVYTGTIHSKYQDITPLLDAFSQSAELRDTYNIEFYGSNFSDLKKLVIDRKLNGVVKIFSAVSRKQALLKQQSADILLFLPWNDVAQKGILTGKIFEYIGARRPILAISDDSNDASKIILENDFGTCASNADDITLILLSNDFTAYNPKNHEKFERTKQVSDLMLIFKNLNERR